jgi:hypothetical protein
MSCLRLAEPGRVRRETPGPPAVTVRPCFSAAEPEDAEGITRDGPDPAEPAPVPETVTAEPSSDRASLEASRPPRPACTGPRLAEGAEPAPPGYAPAPRRRSGAANAREEAAWIPERAVAPSGSSLWPDDVFPARTVSRAEAEDLAPRREARSFRLLAPRDPPPREPPRSAAPAAHMESPASRLAPASRDALERSSEASRWTRTSSRSISIASRANASDLRLQTPRADHDYNQRRL